MLGKDFTALLCGGRVCCIIGLCIVCIVCFARVVCGKGIIALVEKFVRRVFVVSAAVDVVGILFMGFGCVCRGSCFVPAPNELGIGICDRPGVDIDIEFIVCVIGTLDIVCIVLRPPNIVFCVALLVVVKPIVVGC